jgi:hypothetical protein
VRVVLVLVLVLVLVRLELAVVDLVGLLHVLEMLLEVGGGMTVLFLNTCAAVLGSRAPAGLSSRSRMSAYTARARDTRCFSPPDGAMPLVADVGQVALGEGRQVVGEAADVDGAVVAPCSALYSCSGGEEEGRMQWRG